MKTGALFAGGLIVALVVGLQACGSDDSSGASASSNTPKPCNEDPWTCPDGQTCWLASDQQHFECLNSGPGNAGDDCKNVIGSPSCGDDLTCFAVTGYPNVCTPFCDPTNPDHKCPNDGACQLLITQGSQLQFYACVPEGGQGGAGGEGGNGGHGGAGAAGGAGGIGAAGGAGGAGNTGGKGGAGGTGGV